jgi:hypothetical protein
MRQDDELRAAVEAAVNALTPEELEHELNLRRDIPDELTFIEALHIEDKESGSLVPFRLWASQKEILPLLGERRLFILKARQLGQSWLVEAHWLYEATFWGNRLILLARQTLDDCRDAIHRLKVMHASLPPEWQAKVTIDKATMFGFANGSRFRALTSTKRMGRSAAAYGAMLDEFAFWDNEPEQLAALEAAGARIHIVTTGNGPGDHAHKLWMAAQRGEGPWRTVFLPWSAHPQRTEAWYAANVEAAIEPRLAKREYAACPEDAFAAPEGIFFERFLRERNVKEFSVIENWSIVRALDFGYHFPACVWVQTSPAGQPFVVAELLGHDMTTDEFATAILEREATFGLAVECEDTYGDPAGRGVSPQTAESEVEVFNRRGIWVSSTPSSVRDGCVRLMNLLADPKLPLVISTACPWTIEALASVGPDRHKPDIYDERSPYTHVLDALRYWTINRAEPMEPYSEWGPQIPPSGGYRLPGINGRPLPNPTGGYVPSPYGDMRLPRPY